MDLDWILFGWILVGSWWILVVPCADIAGSMG
jgi:hypothetical protein